MKLQTLALTNFRNYGKREFAFADQTILLGPNGSGKSNLLEAIYLISTGKSFRADRDFEMIKLGESFATLVAGTNETNLKVIITERKKFEVNGVPRRMQDFLGHLKAILFTPMDIELLTGSPGGRRRYLDFVLSQINREYRRSLISYERGLRQRNHLLEAIRDFGAPHSQLFFWDRLLIKNGNYLTDQRQDYLQNLSLEKYKIIYDKSEISEARLQQYEVEEVAAAATLVGPHRDDFVILQNGQDVAKFGSRGEQRMAVLWLKQGEILALSKESLPILLLDDIFSELDVRHREEVLQIVAQHQLAGGQIVLTSADEQQVPVEFTGSIIKL